MGQSKSSKIDVTIAIPTFNGEEYLEDLLVSVYGQSTKLKYEVLIIDSGSKDKTLSIIKGFPQARLHLIPNSEFGHGKTRNLAVKMSKGNYTVFLSQDAVPANKEWLDSMIEPFYISEKVFCVFGKQIPRPDADATTKREVSTVFDSLGPDHSIMLHRGKSLVSGNKLSQQLTFFSDVNSAVRKSLSVNDIPYRDVSYAEDQLLGIDVLERGFLKAYSPDAVVSHSNKYSLSKYFNRRVDEFSATKRLLGINVEHRLSRLLKTYLIDVKNDWVFTLKDKDYSLHQKIQNYIEIPYRNFQKQRASYIVGVNKKIEHHSLEAIERKLNN